MRRLIIPWHYHPEPGPFSKTSFPRSTGNFWISPSSSRRSSPEGSTENEEALRDLAWASSISVPSKTLEVLQDGGKIPPEGSYGIKKPVVGNGGGERLIPPPLYLPTPM